MLDRRSLLRLLPLAPPLLAQPDPFDAAPFVAAFDYMWSTIRDKYWDPQLAGLDWDNARLEIRPRVEASASAAEARKALAGLLARIKQSHFGLIPAPLYAALDPAKGPRGDAGPGFDFRILAEGPVVTSVTAGSPAAEAGIRPGWIFRPDDDLSGLPPLRRHFATMARLRAPGGANRSLNFEDASGASRTITLQFAPPPGKLTRFGNLPPIPLSIESRRERQAVVLSLNAFFDPEWLQKECASVVDAAASAKGVIIDLRGNLGGIAGLAPAVTGWFVKAPVSLGTLMMRGVTLKLVANPRPAPYLGPVAVLIDGLSMSTAEFLAAGLKDIGRARLFGENSAGAALPSIIEKLATGDGFQYAIARYESASGQTLEGAGVAPHVIAPPSRQALSAGMDPALEQALQWINQENSNA